MRPFPTLASDDVHIWQIPLSGQSQLVHALRTHLSADEKQRADRFHFDHHRESFVVAHAAMRQLLAGYVKVVPENLTFIYGEQGKPDLAAKRLSTRIRFNLSHSGDFALLAVAENLTLGVDIERINPQFAAEGIAERFFSPDEVINLLGIAAEARAEAFFSCWTRKEAFI